MLPFYAERFNTTEVKITSFRRIPEPENDPKLQYPTRRRNVKSVIRKAPATEGDALREAEELRLYHDALYFCQVTVTTDLEAKLGPVFVPAAAELQEGHGLVGGVSRGCAGGIARRL